MTKMLDILGDYLNLKKIKFCRLDGSMQFMDRQENIDTFNKDPDHKVSFSETKNLVTFSSMFLFAKCLVANLNDKLELFTLMMRL